MIATPKSKELTLIPSETVSTPTEKICAVIDQRQTEELVIAFCGPLGSGISTVAHQFEKMIKIFGYQTHYLKTSHQISKYLPLIGFDKITTTDAAKKIERYQDAGNALRERHGYDILAQFLIQEIAIERERQKKKEIKEEVKPNSRRHITIIDSLKHPDEVKLLKAVYGNMFYLFAVLCPEKIRRERLITNKRVTSGKEVALMERDKSETSGFGQKLLDTLHYADFFIRNDEVNVTLLGEKLKRYINLILGDSFITPTMDEYAMYIAQSAALKSSCLSRQVGASIVSKDGELISSGCNDVPKYGGGYYSSDDEGADGRCMKMFGQECVNEKYKKSILSDIDAILEKNKVDTQDVRKAILDQISKQDRMKNLLEFSRSVHAEMDAIINVARLGNASLREATLYCTTFPCHNCARHIVASGITKLYYIDPYEKSLARGLHNDAIDFDSKINETPPKKVAFTPFEGVAPRQYMNLFMAGERKNQGRKIEQDLSISKPRVRQYLDNHVDYETKVIEHLKKSLEKA